MLVFVLHATTNFFTFDQTYDAYVHIFFADHYAEGWFDNWDYRWYTGFNIISYPPLVHQIVALMSFILGLKLAFFVWSVLMVLWMVRGMYNFSQLWVSKEASGIAAILMVFTGSLTEALHIFGQVPSITGMAFLLNACPEIYKWVCTKKKSHLWMAIAFLSVTSAAHHVTTIFGMVFFVFPVIGIAIFDLCEEEKAGGTKVTIKDFLTKIGKNLKSLIPFGLVVGIIMILVILPYWLWTKSDPISQVSIPHGSRESFIDNPDLGIMFFLLPWGIMLFALPYIFARSFKRRHIFLGLSLALLFVLGTGGTTPIPRWILGDTAYEILTLDRFTFWATIISVPFFGEFIQRLYSGDLKKFRYNTFFRRFTLLFFSLGIILFNVLIVNATYFQAFQPKEIDPKPIVNFLERDMHSNWRFLTLGFGDQMAWLSANTDALSVDGNYHSARRLPEMTTKAVERLENAKYQGEAGISSLKEFLTIPEKFSLKFVFANDKFYEPMLYFLGWDKIGQLENNVVVWERPDVPPLPDLLPRQNIPSFQRFIWGVLPMLCFTFAFLIYLRYLFRKKWKVINIDIASLSQYAMQGVKSKSVWFTQSAWMIFLLILSVGFVSFVAANQYDHATPKKVLNAYFDALNYKDFTKAYSYLDKETRPILDQYMLELSLEDGILASYSILDTLEILDIQYEDSNHASVDVNLLSTTSLMNYRTKETIQLVRRDKSWYLMHEDFDKDVPVDQFYGVPDVAYFNQGRRKADVRITRREDVLDRPEAFVIQANLVQKNDQYHIVGEIQNIDNVPAYITVDGSLMDEKGYLLARYNAGNAIIRRLLPNEKTPFRIDFIDKIEDAGNKLYLEDKRDYKDEYFKAPKDFNVFVRTMVSGQKMYKLTGIKDLAIKGNELTGALVNYGTNEISIPQILLAEYSADGQMKWLEDVFLESGIRPQREKEFTLKSKIDEVMLIKKGSGYKLFVNGTSKVQIDYFEEIDDHIGIDKVSKINKIDQSILKVFTNGFVYDLN